MSTLPPTPSYNANVPVVTSSGGTSAAYKDPNSPESIMRKTTLIHAQTAVDTTYDVAIVKEGFIMHTYDTKYILIFFIITLMFIVFSSGKNLKPSAKVFVSLLAGLLILITIVLQQNGTSGTVR